MCYTENRRRKGKKSYQVVLPLEHHRTALQGLHDDARHSGVEKTLSLVRDHCFWLTMPKEVEQYVKSCECCIKRKIPPQTAPITPIKATHPLQFVTVDYLTVKKAMDFENILVIVNHFTKFAQAYPAKNQKASTTGKLVLDFMRKYGYPEQFHSDQGQNFVGKVMQNLYKLVRINQSQTTIFHPMDNGLSEGFN